MLVMTMCLGACTDSNYYRIGGYAQGGTYSVKYKGAKLPAAKIQDAVDSLLWQIDNTLSGYNKTSLLSRFNAGDTITLTPMFAQIYEQSYRVWEEFDGAFDVAYAPLYDIWGFGFSQDQEPSDIQVRKCRDDYGMGKLKGPDEINALIGSRITARDFLKNDEDKTPRLNFNAIAQGYSCDIIADYLRGLGVEDMLVDIGEIYCCGHNPNGHGWNVGIDNPVDGNDTPGADIRQTWDSQGRSTGIVTSGNYRKFYIKDGRKYAHTIDPRTGYPVTHSLLSATVIAPTASQADALATVFMVIGEAPARQYLSEHPELDACLISADGVWETWDQPSKD